MLNTIVHSDEITLWWDKEWEIKEKVQYRVFCDGNVVGETDKTHFSLKNLQPQTVYCVRIERGDFCVGEARIQTGKEKRKIDITKAPYFALPDGKTMNTAAIQKAFDDCKADECVYFPKGTYLSGALRMHGDMELYLDEGAVLQGSEKVKDYLPKIHSRFEGIEMECYSALLNMGELDHTAGYNCKNVVIRGGGIVSGGGKTLCDAIIETERERLKDYLAANAEYVKTCENDRTIPGRARPRLVNMSNCQNIVLANVTFQYGPAWNVHFVYSENIVTYGCKIISQGVWNGDGWNPDSSENCTIFNTVFGTHDDAIAIKSGKNPEGNIINRPTKNIRIFDCRGRNGIALGSEMSGGIDGVYIWDCDISTSYAGLRVKVTKKRGGFVRNVKVRDCSFTDIKVWCVPWNDDGESAPTPPKVENFELENIALTCICTNVNVGKQIPINAITLLGIEEEEYHLQKFTFKNICIHNHIENGSQIFEMKNVREVTFENIYFK